MILKKDEQALRRIGGLAGGIESLRQSLSGYGADF